MQCPTFCFDRISAVPAEIVRRPLMLRCAAAAVAALFCLALQSRVHAAGGDDAEALIKQGVELRKQGQDREALAEFERARAFGDTPRLTAQIGLAQFALGQWVSAEASLKTALSDLRDPWIQRNRPSIADALERVGARLGSVEVWGEPTGAEVFVNGKRIGALPSPPPIRVVVGTASLAVRADGFEQVTRQLAVPAKGHVREYVELARSGSAAESQHARRLEARALPAAPPPGAAPTNGTTLSATASSGSEDAMAGAPTHQGEPAARGSDSILTRWWFWTAIGAVAAGGIAGYVLTAPKRLGCPAATQCFP